MMFSKITNFISSALLIMTFSHLASAQSTPWPQEKPIQIWLGQPAGYAPDLTTRWFADALSKELGQSVIVVNKPQGNGRPMLNELRKTAPDGYTFGNVFWTMMATWPTLFPNLEFNPAQDFTHLGIWASGPQVIATYPGSGVTSWKDAVTQSKNGSKPLQYGTYGAVSPGAIYMAYAAKQTGAVMEPVNFRGADGPLALIRKDVPLLIGGVADVLEQVKAGAIVPIAISTRERWAQWPQVPTFAEVGVQGLDEGIWAGLVAAPGVPADIAEKMNAAMRRAIANPELIAKNNATARVAMPTSGAEMKARIQRDMDRWGRVIRDAGIKVQ